MMLSTQECVFRFGDVEVREREFRLIKAGEVIPVEPKAFRVLLFLLHNPQKLITKEELLNAVWGDTAVSENSLTRSIALLRRLLGEDTHEHRFIETVATVGYRFVCPVGASGDTQGDPALTDSAKTASASEAAPTGNETAIAPIAYARSSRRRVWIMLASTAAVALLATAVWYLHRPLPPPRINEEFAQITHDGHLKYLFGADGSRLYFTQEDSSIAQVGIAGGDIVRIPVGLPNPFLWDVSPDGSTLLVRSANTLWSVEIPGGALRRLVSNGLAGNWSPDGKSLICSTLNGDILVMRSDGTGAHILVPMKALGEQPFTRFFAWSPDGTKIRFELFTGTDRSDRLFEMSSDGSGLHELLPGWHPSSWKGAGRWTQDGRFYLFLSAVPDTGTSGGQIWVLDERRGLFRRPPAEPIQLTSGPIRWWMPVPSKDGKKIFTQGTILRGELVRYDAQSRQLQPFLGGMSAEFVAFSPDGKSMAYVSYPEGILRRANRDGSNSVHLTDPPWYPIYPRWSPDGTQILFGNSDNRAYIISSLGGTPQPILPDDKGVQGDPNWSPDGRRVVLCRGRFLDPKSDIRILDLASREVTIVPGSLGIFSPRWSPDGRFIVALNTLTGDLKVFDFQTQRWSLLQKGPVGFPAFSRDGRFVYFLRLQGESPGVFRIRTSGGSAERVVDLKGFHHGGYFGSSMALEPEDAPLVLRDAGSYEIYALTLEEK